MKRILLLSLILVGCGRGPVGEPGKSCSAIKIGNVTTLYCDGQSPIEINDGIDGQDGLNGTNGINGQDGQDGLNGTNGVDGQDGQDGLDGRDGQDAAPITRICIKKGHHRKCYEVVP